MSYMLTDITAKRAVDIVRPTIEELLKSKLVGGRENFHLVILNPTDGEILYEESFGQPKHLWNKKFDEIARAKARKCYQARMVIRTLKSDAPWLYEEGDTRYVGGVFENGLVVAGSGLQDYLDEMISWMILSAIQGLCRDYMAKIADEPYGFF